MPRFFGIRGRHGELGGAGGPEARGERSQGEVVGAYERPSQQEQQALAKRRHEHAREAWQAAFRDTDLTNESVWRDALNDVWQTGNLATLPETATDALETLPAEGEDHEHAPWNIDPKKESAYDQLRRQIRWLVRSGIAAHATAWKEQHIDRSGPVYATYQEFQHRREQWIAGTISTKEYTTNAAQARERMLLHMPPSARLVEQLLQHGQDLAGMLDEPVQVLQVRFDLTDLFTGVEGPADRSIDPGALDPPWLPREVRSKTEDHRALWDLMAQSYDDASRSESWALRTRDRKAPHRLVEDIQLQVERNTDAYSRERTAIAKDALVRLQEEGHPVDLRLIDRDDAGNLQLQREALVQQLAQEQGKSSPNAQLVQRYARGIRTIDRRSIMAPGGHMLPGVRFSETITTKFPELELDGRSLDGAVKRVLPQLIEGTMPTHESGASLTPLRVMQEYARALEDHIDISGIGVVVVGKDVLGMSTPELKARLQDIANANDAARISAYPTAASLPVQLYRVRTVIDQLSKKARLPKKAR